MKNSYFVICAVIVAGFVLTAGSQRPQFSLRIHVEAGSQVRDERVIPIGLVDPDEVIRVHKLPVVSEKNLIQAAPTSSGGVLLGFNQAGMHSLETATRTEMGKTMIVIMNGRVVYAAEIDMAMSSGRLLIPGGLQKMDYSMLEAHIKQRNRL